MYLSKNFTLTELIKSQKTVRLGIDNKPRSKQIYHLKNLCENVLQTISDRFVKPVIVSSGFRSIELCQAIGSSSNSQHAKCQAADIDVLSVDNQVLADWIKNNLIYDQLILDFYKESDPHSGWIHVSYINDKPRKEALKACKDKGKTRYFQWS